MGTRGRQSTASKALDIVKPLETVVRPDAPYDLTDEQTDEWRAITNRLPADWFPRETHSLLTQYCRHVVAARRLSQLIDQEEKKAGFDVSAYDQLLKMQEREGRAMSSLATRMRITQQATYDPKRKKGKSVSRPWEK